MIPAILTAASHGAIVFCIVMVPIILVLIVIYLYKLVRAPSLAAKSRKYTPLELFEQRYASVTLRYKVDKEYDRAELEMMIDECNELMRGSHSQKQFDGLHKIHRHLKYMLTCITGWAEVKDVITVVKSRVGKGREVVANGLKSLLGRN